jgi:glycosyltransferase involved in cell wall biosynthesis
VESVLKTKFGNDDVLLIDNGSKNGNHGRMKRKFGNEVTIIRMDENVGISSAWNASLDIFLSSTPGFTTYDYRFICFLHNDTIVENGWLTDLKLAFDMHKKAGISFPMQEEKEGRFAVSYREFPHDFCFMMKRETAEKVGKFNRDFEIKAGMEYFQRVRDNNMELVIASRSRVKHLGGKTSSRLYSLSYYTKKAMEEMSKITVSQSV